jgi:L-histidine Nalpha-methyltransferase / hercynylcysteine S-oxide synthase
VDNPELCHAHSEVPDNWPALDEMLEYQVRVRDRVVQQTNIAESDRKVGRALWLAFEHEAMHLETFLYMLLQSERVLPPPGRPIPDFKSMAAKARQNRVANKWHRVPAAVITLGLDDPENDLGPDRFFGWDNERPSRKSAVAQFEAQARPISNGEYARFLEQSGFKLPPASWSVPAKNGASSGANGVYSKLQENGHANHVRGDEPSEDFVHGKFVRTVYGPVPLEYALDWPVMASYDELAAFAKWFDGRIPTLEEARSIYSYVDATRKEAAEKPSSLISAVNGFVNEIFERIVN